MRHIDDGRLHAFLDGALDHLSAEEAGWIRDHLEACAACRERLEAAGEVRSRAEGILDLGAPERTDVPPFEVLRRRAAAADDGPSPASGSGGGSTHLPRLRTLAWAASVVLALGIGWGVGQGGGVAGPDAPGDARLPSAPEARSAAAKATGAEVPQATAAAPAAAAPAETAAGEPRPREGPATPVVAEGDLAERVGTRVAPVDTPSGPRPATEAPGVPPGETGTTRAERVVAAADTTGLPVAGGRAETVVAPGARELLRRSQELDAPVVTAADTLGPSLGVRAAEASPEPAPEGTWMRARDMAGVGGNLALARTDVESVSWVRDVGVPTIRVVHRLEDGTRVELLHLLGPDTAPAGAAPRQAALEDAVSPVPEGWNRVGRVRPDGGRVELRGPLPTEALSRLLERLPSR